MFSSSQFEPNSAVSGGGFMSSQPSQAYKTSSSTAKVSLVGLVCEKDVSKVTEVRYTLEDGTGRIDCKRWVNETFDAREMESVRDGTYVRLNGHLKTFQGPIMDFNEVTFHYIKLQDNRGYTLMKLLSN